MTTVKALFDGFVGHGGIPVELHAGDEYDADDPVVTTNPDKFTEPKRGPGRPPGSKSQPKGERD